MSEQGLSFGFVCSAMPDEVPALEDLGIDSLWVGGHVAYRNPLPEAMVQLVRLATLARRVRIGTSILLLPLYPPAIVAKQIADLDNYCGGRITLGVGVGGEYEPEFRACGVPMKERGKRTDEAIPLLRRLWSGEEISHPGPFYPMEKVRIQPVPLQPGGPTIVVAGRQEAAMRRAGNLGDGWMPYLYSPRRYAESVGRIRAFAAAAGRDLARFEWLEFLCTNIQDDGERARDEVAEFLGGSHGQDFRPRVERVAAAGTLEEVVARAKEFIAAGARHLVFLPGSRNRMRMAKRIARELIPALRQT